MSRTPPALIRDDAIDWEPYPAFTGTFRIKRHISREGQGSELGLGVCALEQGQSTVWWSFIADDPSEDVRMSFGDRAHEAYYVLDGRFTFRWQDEHGAEDSVEAGPGDVFYFAPGWRYRVENTGGTPARFLWCMAPSAD
jgi:mannose-6-phosphate isomerase-like protein (cupin superfamily)